MWIRWAGWLQTTPTNKAKMKLEGQFDVVQYCLVTVPDSFHMGDPASGYLEVLKASISTRGHEMAWHDNQAMRKYLNQMMTGLNLKRKKYGMVNSWEVNDDGLEQLAKTSWRKDLLKYFK